MREELIPLWLGLCLVGGFCAYSWYWYIRSIIFNRKNGFDFSKDFGPEIFFGEFRDEGFFAKPKAKFCFGMPFVLAVTSLHSISIVLSLMGIIKACIDCGEYGLPI
ncbi:hypothetical protein ELH50_01215 [Rhizobium ruizarguesonis]|nr:hypothetical protein ELH50_01215 [Rhizobium ruizarguesonis]